MAKNKNVYLAVGVVAVVLVVVLLLIFTNTNNSPNSSESETIKIGAVYPLTGPFSSYGVEYKRGLELAAEEINSQGGIMGKKIELIFEDDQGVPEKSVTAVNKLINVDNVKYLFTAFSSSSQATAPIAQANKVLYFSATVSKIGDVGNYVFRDFWDIEDQGKAIGSAINKEGVKKVGIIAMNFGDTETFLNAVKSVAKNTTFIEERFNFGDSDFKTQLTKFKDSGVDAILVYAFPGAEAITITNQIKELGLDNLRLFAGATTYGLPFMYSQFSDTLAKMKAIDSWYSLDENNPKAVEFTKKYEEKYGEPLVGDAAYPYDDLYALKMAIEQAGTSESTMDVAEALKRIELQGAAGPLVFDENGNSKREAYLQIYSDNGWVKYE